ncbi:MAG: AAA family ATPase [Nanoarchaeota archaeon]|nr:AAA family ATPase [Nanoarchaeota archaeon]
MIIKKVKLENIRSYVEQEIELPQGSVLLSGDIGSGKSTVLLAIDFALFGIRKSDLLGASILRNGASTGSVELHFETDGKDIVIKRNLKRTSSSVSQDSGFIFIDGIKKEGTAIELKQNILTLLNYPKELLTKSKSLIYKYTVYTPQEEMKHILVEDKDLRLDTLRKVFGIDKYKRIRENTKVLTSAIKGKKKEQAGMIHDLEQKKEDMRQKKEQLQEENKKLEEIQPRLELLRQDSEKKKKEIEVIEIQIKESNEIKSQIEIKNSEHRTKEKQKFEVVAELEKLTEDVANLETEAKELVEENIDIHVKTREEKIDLLEKETQESLNEITVLKTKKEQAESLKNGIIMLSNCPTCKQQVREEHKKIIEEEENNKITAINKKLAIIEQNYKEKQQELVENRKELEQLKERKNLIEINKVKRQNLDEKKKKKENLEVQRAIIEKELEGLKEAILNLEEGSKTYQNIDENYKIRRQELERLQERKSELDKEEAVIKNELKSVTEIITGLKLEIDQKEKIKQSLFHLTNLQEWLEKQFINLMEVMEKNIMFKVHNDFDSLFQKWFSMIIKEEALQSKLDVAFTPLIEQNGHDIDYLFLSGGEKTAIALAYRLALNQVINKLMRNIKTSDLLILDEPTDGFSSEQLDRVKDVIEDLDLKQVIIVSHEPKVESFVEKIIRFEKENHTSKLVEINS